jgi:hypothetical protein
MKTEKHLLKTPFVKGYFLKQPVPKKLFLTVIRLQESYFHCFAFNSLVFFVLFILTNACTTFVSTHTYSPSKNSTSGISDTNYYQANTNQLKYAQVVKKSAWFKNMSFSLGTFNYLGDGLYAPLPNPNISGLGIQADANYLITTPNTDWKVPGIAMQATQDFDNPWNSKPVYTLGLGSEIAFQINPQQQLGLKLFAGKPFGKDHSSEKYLHVPAVTSSASVYTQRRHVTAFAQLRLSQKINFSFGFSYTFNKKIRKAGIYK